jgi:hypothetical protein
VFGWNDLVAGVPTRRINEWVEVFGARVGPPHNTFMQNTIDAEASSRGPVPLTSEKHQSHSHTFFDTSNLNRVVNR